MRNSINDRRYFSWPDFIVAVVFGALLVNYLTGVFPGIEGSVAWITFTIVVFGWTLLSFVSKLATGDQRTRELVGNWSAIVSGTVMILFFAPLILSEHGWDQVVAVAVTVLGVILLAVPVANLRRMRRDAVEVRGERR
jgi:hypothetical protein